MCLIFSILVLAVILFITLNSNKSPFLNTDVPLSYGLVEVKISQRLNAAEFVWDPHQNTGIYIKVHCISTEFTPKKHGGEKGVPFRVQVETYLHEDDGDKKLLHCASCQVKVFKVRFLSVRYDVSV